MTINYWLIFIYFGFIAFMAYGTDGIYRIEGANEYRYKWIWAILMFLPLIIIAGQRDKSIADTYAYVSFFEQYPNNLSKLFTCIDSTTKDKGFVVFSILIKQFLGSNYHNYLMVIAVISGVATLIPYKKYSCNYLISIFLFLASTDYMSWMMNGMRQYMVVSLTFLCSGLILKKKYVHCTIIILILSTCHLSALIMLPTILLVQGEAWNSKTVLFLVSIIIFILGIGTFTSILDHVLSETTYNNVVAQFSSDDGTNILRVLVYSVPTIIAFIYRKRIKEVTKPIINISINMSILSMGFYIVSIFTSGIYIGRIPIYFSLYNYILLPWEIEFLFEKEIKRLIYFVMIVSYLIFFYVQMYITWQ